jgi:hypothetical protein
MRHFTIYCSRPDGLGTRLMNLGWSWRLARKMGAITVAAWQGVPPTLAGWNWRGARVSDILDMKSIMMKRKSPLRIYDGEYRPDPSWPMFNQTSGWKRKSYNIDAANFFHESNVVCYEHHIPLLFSGENLKEASIEFSSLMRSLPLTEPVERARGAALSASGGADFIAIHCRRGDLVDNIRIAATKINEGAENSSRDLDAWLTYYIWKSTPLSVVINTVESVLNRDMRVYLSTDDADSRSKINAKYGDMMIVGPEAAQMSGLQYDMADIVIQSDAREILGAQSAFPRAASLIGNVPLNRMPASLQDFEADLVDILEPCRLPSGVVDFALARLQENVLLGRRVS